MTWVNEGEIRILLRSISEFESIYLPKGKHRHFQAQVLSIDQGNKLIAVGTILEFSLKKPMYGVCISLASSFVCPFYQSLSSYEFACGHCPYFNSKELECQIEKVRESVISIGGILLEDFESAKRFAEKYAEIFAKIHEENLSLAKGLPPEFVKMVPDAWKFFIVKEKGVWKSFGDKAIHLGWINEIEKTFDCRFDPFVINPYMAYVKANVWNRKR